MKFHVLFVFILAFITKGYCLYSEGIPYAKPILDISQRFQPPTPVEPWDTTLFATADKNVCLQMNNEEVVGSEDCLYLNIYVPKFLSNTPNFKPVLVWIHGGAFRTGNGNSTYYGPDFLLEEDLVVVSIQYRLGALGFLNINHPGATGNMGLKDQNLALRWIRNNIEYFGGDPNRVTLLGQSAGGVSVDLHKLSEMSSGLFQYTISMSASPLCRYWAFQSRAEAETTAFTLGQRLGIYTEDGNVLINRLMNIPASDIIRETNSLIGIAFRPTLENPEIAPEQEKFLTECTPKKYKAGEYNKGPHLMGFTSTELLIIMKSLDDLVQFVEDTKQLVRGIRFVQSIPFVSQILSLTFGTIDEVKDIASDELIKQLSNIYFAAGIDMKQRLLAGNNEDPIYYYQFDFQSQFSAHESEGIDNLDGAAHEDDLPHIFYRPHLKLPLYDSKIKLTRERMVRMWANFAKTGNPTPYGEQDPLLNFVWPDSGDIGTHLRITNELQVIEDRPTDLLVTLLQKFGFADSCVFNDCEKNFLTDLVNNLVNIPNKVIDILYGVKDVVTSFFPRIWS